MWIHPLKVDYPLMCLLFRTENFHQLSSLKILWKVEKFCTFDSSFQFNFLGYLFLSVALNICI